jgi:hypothetical protein
MTRLAPVHPAREHLIPSTIPVLPTPESPDQSRITFHRRCHRASFRRFESAAHRCSSTRLTSEAIILIVGRKVRFYEPYRPLQVRWGTTGVLLHLEERPTQFGRNAWVRARFGDFITPWIEEWRLEPVP